MVTTTALLVTAIALTAVSAGVGAYGAYASAQAQKDASKYNAAVARNAAMTAEQQGQFDAQQVRDKNRRLLATQRAYYAGSGVDPNSGTAQDVMTDTATSGELEALTAIYTGRTSATANLAQARLDKMNANAASTAGWIGMGSSILGGATSATMIAANPNFRK